MYAGRLYLPVPSRVLVLSFAACYAAVTLVFRRAGKRPERQVLPLSLRLCGRSITLRALRDTGNGLYDPVSGRAAAVADPGLDCQGSDAASLCEALCKLDGLAGRVTLLPYSALGTGRGLIAALRPDSVSVDGEPADILIGLSPAPLSGDGEFDAIL